MCSMQRAWLPCRLYRPASGTPESQSNPEQDYPQVFIIGHMASARIAGVRNCAKGPCRVFRAFWTGALYRNNVAR